MYAILCFDRPDSASLRDSHRAAHLAFLEKNSARIVFGGPLKNTPDGASTGALIVCDSPLGEVGEVLQVAFGFVLHDVPVSLQLRAEIRTVEETAEQLCYRHGVAFVEPDPNDRLVLAALVWYNMYENPKLSI